MNIFCFEFRNYWRSLWIWILSLISILVMYMAFYPILAEDAAVLDIFLRHYPEELLKAFGLGGELSLATVAGFFAFSFAFAQLCAAVQSAYYGFNFMSVEERELTADFLYSKPVGRKNILISKYLAAMMALLITNAGLWAGSFLSIELFRGENSYDLWPVISLLLTVPIFQLFFFSCGFIATVLTRKITGAIGPAVGLAFALYILNALRGVFGGELLGLISPYYHFDPNYILRQGDWNIAPVLLSVGFIVIANIAAYAIYLRRDIHSAV